MQLEPVAVVSFRDGSRRPSSDYAGREVIAAAAIGNPERYLRDAARARAAVETRTLPDHARFTPALAGAGRGKPVLLTEKDAVKCGGVRLERRRIRRGGARRRWRRGRGH